MPQLCFPKAVYSDVFSSLLYNRPHPEINTDTILIYTIRSPAKHSGFVSCPLWKKNSGPGRNEGAWVPFSCHVLFVVFHLVSCSDFSCLLWPWHFWSQWFWIWCFLMIGPGSCIFGGEQLRGVVSPPQQVRHQKAHGSRTAHSQNVYCFINTIKSLIKNKKKPRPTLLHCPSDNGKRVNRLVCQRHLKQPSGGEGACGAGKPPLQGSQREQRSEALQRPAVAACMSRGLAWSGWRTQLGSLGDSLVNGFCSKS